MKYLSKAFKNFRKKLPEIISTVLACIVYFPLFPMWEAIYWVNQRRWNNGVCRHCESGGWKLSCYKGLCDIFICGKCGGKFKSVAVKNKSDELSEEKLKQLIREKKLKKLVK